VESSASVAAAKKSVVSLLWPFRQMSAKQEKTNCHVVVTAKKVHCLPFVIVPVDTENTR
jgi:hypothetical protein